MDTLRPCYAVVVMDDSGERKDGRPVIMETPLSMTLHEATRKADQFAERYGGAMVIELPIMQKVEFVRVAGQQEKTVYEAGGNSS